MDKLEKIEKKVDLLYKILLELYVDYVGHPYDQKYINNFMDELIPLFGLSAEEIEIEILPTQKEINELKSRLETELSRLKKVYESGNFLAKDGDKIKDKIANITNYLQEWDVCVDEWILAPKEDIISRSEDICKISLFVDLKKKLGLGVGNTYISYDKDGAFDLIERRDTLKKNTKDFIEKIRNLGKANN